MATDYQDIVEEMELFKLRSERFQRKVTWEANAKHELGLQVASMERKLEGWKSKVDGVLKEKESSSLESEEEPIGLEEELIREGEWVQSHKAAKSKVAKNTSMPVRKRQRMLHVEDLEALFELIPPTSNLEFAYGWKREVFFLHNGLS